MTSKERAITSLVSHSAGLEEQIESFKKDHDDLKIVVIDVMQMVRSNVESSYGSDYAELIALKQGSAAQAVSQRLRSQVGYGQKDIHG